MGVKSGMGSQKWACTGGIKKFHETALKVIVSLSSFLMSLPSTIYTFGSPKTQYYTYTHTIPCISCNALR